MIYLSGILFHFLIKMIKVIQGFVFVLATKAIEVSDHALNDMFG